MTVVVYAVLLLMGVALLTVTVVRTLVGGVADSPRAATRARPTSRTAAQRILEERYAAGELSTEEFEHRLRVLHGGDR